jgi:hypothetical protein
MAPIPTDGRERSASFFYSPPKDNYVSLRKSCARRILDPNCSPLKPWAKEKTRHGAPSTTAVVLHLARPRATARTTVQLGVLVVGNLRWFVCAAETGEAGKHPSKHVSATPIFLILPNLLWRHKEPVECRYMHTVELKYWTACLPFPEHQQSTSYRGHGSVKFTLYPYGGMFFLNFLTCQFNFSILSD